MRKSTRISAAVAGAALVVVAGTAFTNAVNGLPTTRLDAYGKTTISAVTATDPVYHLKADHSDTWDYAEFTTTTNITDPVYVVTLMVNHVNNAATCVKGEYTTTMTVRCTGDVEVNTTTDIGFSIVQTGDPA